MWYPDEKAFCNKTDGGHGLRPSKASLLAEFDCMEQVRPLEKAGFLLF